MSLHLHLRAAVTAAAAILCVTAAPAAAAPVAIYGGHLPNDAPFSLRVGADGRTVESLLAHVDLKCEDGRFLTLSGESSFGPRGPATPAGDTVFSPERLSKRGVLRATGTGSAEFGAGPATVTQRLRGTVRRGVARGTLSATLVLTETATGAKHTCRSGSLRWEAFSNPGHVYAGLTSDGRPVVLQRSRNGRKVDAFWVSFNAPCQKEGGFAIGEELLNFPLSSGAFGDTWTYEPDPKTSAAYSLRGRVGASRASGTFQVQVTVKDDAGATADTCDTTLLRWSARSTKGAKIKRKKAEIRVGAAALGHMGTS